LPRRVTEGEKRRLAASNETRGRWYRRAKRTIRPFWVRKRHSKIRGGRKKQEEKDEKKEARASPCLDTGGDRRRGEVNSAERDKQYIILLPLS